MIILFKKICAGETLEPAPAPEGEKEIPEILYELPRLQALFEQLNEAGAEPELLRHEQGRSFTTTRSFSGKKGKTVKKCSYCVLTYRNSAGFHIPRITAGF